MQILQQLSPLSLALIASCFTYLLTLLGALSVFLSKKFSPRALAFFNAFAGGVMVAASFFSLLLPALESETEGKSLVVSLGFLAGGILILLVSVLPKKNSSLSEENSSKNKSKLFLLAVTLHNIPEGFAVGVACAACQNNAELVLPALLFAFGIGVQNIPEGVSVAFSLVHGGYSRGKSFFLSQLSGAVEVLAAAAGATLFLGISAVLPFALSLSAGAMIFVTCSSLLPEAFLSDNTVSSVGFLAGFVLMMILDLAL